MELTVYVTMKDLMDIKNDLSATASLYRTYEHIFQLAVPVERVEFIPTYLYTPNANLYDTSKVTITAPAVGESY